MFNVINYYHTINSIIILYLLSYMHFNYKYVTIDLIKIIWLTIILGNLIKNTFMYRLFYYITNRSIDMMNKTNKKYQFAIFFELLVIFL